MLEDLEPQSETRSQLAASTPSPEDATMSAEGENTPGPNRTGKGLRYWAIIAGLSVTALLPAMEGTVVSTALPTIIYDLGGGRLYVWVVNVYFLTR